MINEVICLTIGLVLSNMGTHISEWIKERRNG